MNILILEDSQSETELVQRVLKTDNPEYVFRLAMNKTDYQGAGSYKKRSETKTSGKGKTGSYSIAHPK